MSPLRADANAPKVGLFVTCLVDAMRPRIGFAAIRLLEEAGCIVDVPATQTCCGQPGFNSGDTRSAVSLAQQLIATFEPYDYVVVPSGSCAGMIKVHYLEALSADASWLARATARQDIRDHEFSRRRLRLRAPRSFAARLRHIPR